MNLVMFLISFGRAIFGGSKQPNGAMSIEALEWDTLSLRLDDSANGPRVLQKNLKESSLAAAVDLRDLRILQFACQTKNGLLNSRFRAQIWPILSGSDLQESETSLWEKLPPHRDEDQVLLDVQRSQGVSVSLEDRDQYRRHLNTLIKRFLRTHPKMSYYQGFHDICALFLTVFGDTEAAYNMICVFSMCHLRDFLMPDLTMSTQMLRVVPDLVRSIDAELYNCLSLDELEPFFCLSPLITLFTHDIKEEESLSLIFDQILAAGSLSIVMYIYVALMVNKQSEYLEKIELMEQEDMFSKKDLVHNALSKFLSSCTKADIEEAIQDAYRYLPKHPVDKLVSFKKLGKFSVLKTSSTFYASLDAETLQTRLDLPYDEILDQQLKHNAKLRNSRQVSFLTKVLSNKRGKQMIKLSLTVGILSIVINLLLSKHSTTPLLGIGNHRSWLDFTQHTLRPVFKELLGYP